MTDKPYSKFNEGRIITLRDYLAADRTVLANERTFLAYIRTALTLFVAGVSFIQFFNSILIEIVGWIFVPVGIITFIIGCMRYKKMKSLVSKVKRSNPTTTDTE